MTVYGVFIVQVQRKWCVGESGHRRWFSRMGNSSGRRWLIELAFG